MEILRLQARAIKNQTKGVINATFSKMNYRPGPTNTVATIEKIFTGLASIKYEEVLEEELATKKDINTLYTDTEYKFEIFNSEYRFRLFILHYKEMFPVSLDIDEGILEDIEYKNMSPISSNDELVSIVREIFNSSKVYSVISRMLLKEEK